MLRALTPASEIETAFHTLRGQAGPLCNTETEALRIVVDFHQRGFEDVPEQIFRINEMVTVVHIPVVFNHKAVTARLTHRSDPRLGVAVLCQGGIEHLDKELSNVT